MLLNHSSFLIIIIPSVFPLPTIHKFPISIDIICGILCVSHLLVDMLAF